MISFLYLFTEIYLWLRFNIRVNVGKFYFTGKLEDAMDEFDQNERICRPISNLIQLNEFTKNPPYWPSLAIPRAKRSCVIKNSNLYSNGSICHLDRWEEQDEQQPMRYQYGYLPKTLVCHDMKGGYKDDSHIDGTDNFSAYTFYNWAGIDIFVYFSHHFITIPPLGWINAAHRHGVPILGTLITEWSDGYLLCTEFLNSEEDMKDFVQKLVMVSKHFKFDGWLINIENKVQNVDMLLKFVKHLTEVMHSEIPESIVIWYDSVTIKGDLAWQDCLNDLNRDFFKACDGLFTNYCWSERHLERCVEEAGPRRTDVYVGVDVWGRNFWGGGGFNTAEAVKVIHKHNLSMAIFAPAWTHEGIQQKELMDQQYIVERFHRDDSCTSKILRDINKDTSYHFKNRFFTNCAIKDHFLLRETALWNTIWPYLNTRGPTQLPFKTFFCLGSGNKRHMDGAVQHEEMWFNLNQQEYQLSIPFCSNTYTLENIENTKIRTPQNDNTENDSHVHNEPPKIPGRKPPIVRYNVKPNFSESKCISPYTDTSYKGGSCVKLLPITYTEDNVIKNYITRLFICQFLCDFNFIIYYIFKSESLHQDLSMVLTIKDNRTNERSKVVLCSGFCNQKYSQEGVHILNPLREINQEKFKQLQMELLTNHSHFYVPVENDRGWTVRYFLLEHPNSTIQEINCSLTNTQGHVLLGGLGVHADILV